jgi:hypothetical protein
MASLATIYTTNSPTMGNTYQVTNKEVDELLLDIHTQRGTICSISQTVFKDAVNTVDDQTYEREYIQRWFDEGHNTSPSSGIELNDKTLTANVEKQAQVEAIEALRPLIKSFLEDRKKLSRLEDFLEAKEKKEKEAEEERKRKEAEAVEEERKRKEEEAAGEERKRKEEEAAEEERKRKEEEINRQKKEAEDQRQKDLQVKYLYDVQVYKRSLGLA